MGSKSGPRTPDLGSETPNLAPNGPKWTPFWTPFLAKIPHFHVVSRDLDPQKGSQNGRFRGVGVRSEYTIYLRARAYYGFEGILIDLKALIGVLRPQNDPQNGPFSGPKGGSNRDPISGPLRNHGKSVK